MLIRGLFVTQLSSLLNSALFYKCSYVIFSRFISRNVRLKRRRFFIKHLANRNIQYGVGFSYTYRRCYKLLMKKWLKRNFYFRRRMLFFKILGWGLFSHEILLSRLLVNRWRWFFFIKKLFFNHIRLKLRQNFSPPVQLFSVAQFILNPLKFNVFYKPWHFTQLDNLRYSLHYSFELNLNKKARRRFKLFWLKRNKPWWRFFFVVPRGFYRRLVKKYRYYKWARRNYVKQFSMKRQRYRFFLNRAKFFIYGTSRSNGRFLFDSKFILLAFCRFKIDLKSVLTRSIRRNLRWLSGSFGYRFYANKKRFFLKYKLGLKRFLQNKIRYSRPKLRRYRWFALNITSAPHKFSGFSKDFSILSLSIFHKPYWLFDFLFWVKVRKHLLRLHYIRKSRFLYFMRKRVKRSLLFVLPKIFGRYKIRFRRYRCVISLQNSTIFRRPFLRKNWRAMLQFSRSRWKQSLANFFFKSLHLLNKWHLRSSREQNSLVFYSRITISVSKKRYFMLKKDSLARFSSIRLKHNRKLRKKFIKKRWSAYKMRKWRAVVSAFGQVVFVNPKFYTRLFKVLALNHNKFLNSVKVTRFKQSIKFLASLSFSVRKFYFKPIYSTRDKSWLLMATAFQSMARIFFKDVFSLNNFWKGRWTNVVGVRYKKDLYFNHINDWSGKGLPVFRFTGFGFSRKIRRIFFHNSRRRDLIPPVQTLHSFFFFILRASILFLMAFWKILKFLYRIRKSLFSRQLTLLFRVAPFFNVLALSVTSFNKTIKPFFLERRFKTFKRKHNITSSFYVLMRTLTFIVSSYGSRFKESSSFLLKLGKNQRHLLLLVYFFRKFLTLSIVRMRWRINAMFRVVRKCLYILLKIRRFVKREKFLLALTTVRRYGKKGVKKRRFLFKVLWTRIFKKDLCRSHFLFKKNLRRIRFLARIRVFYDRFISFFQFHKKNYFFFLSRKVYHGFVKRFYGLLNGTLFITTLLKAWGCRLFVLNQFFSFFSYNLETFFLLQESIHRPAVLCFRSFKKVVRYYRFSKRRQNFTYFFKLRQRNNFRSFKNLVPINNLFYVRDVKKKLFAPSLYMSTSITFFFNRFFFLYTYKTQKDVFIMRSLSKLFYTFGFLFSFVISTAAIFSFFGGASSSIINSVTFISFLAYIIQLGFSDIRRRFFVSYAKNVIRKLKLSHTVKNWKLSKVYKKNFYEHQAISSYFYKNFFYTNRYLFRLPGHEVNRLGLRDYVSLHTWYNRFSIRKTLYWFLWLNFINNCFFKGRRFSQKFYKSCVRVLRFFFKCKRQTLLYCALGFFDLKEFLLLYRRRQAHIKPSKRQRFYIQQNCYWFLQRKMRFDRVFLQYLFVYVCTQSFYSNIRLLSWFSFFFVHMFSTVWVFLFSHRLDKKEPYILKSQKSQKSQKTQKRWLSVERNKDSRVLKEGAWSKVKTGKKISRRVHFNSRKLLPAARAYIVSTRKRGFTVDITNYFLFFFKFYSQARFHRKKLRFFLKSKFNNISTILSSSEVMLRKYFFNRQKIAFKQSFSSIRLLYFMLLPNISHALINVSSSFWFIFTALSGFVHLKTLSRKIGVRPLYNSAALQNYFYNVNVKFLFIFRKFFRKLNRRMRRQHRPWSMWRYLYDPVFMSPYKKKKNRFFLFTLFKIKKWSICLDNKTSRIFTTESKLKRNMVKITRFKKAAVIKVLQSNRAGTRRRRHLFRLRKQAFQFLESTFKKVKKMFIQRSRRNNSFENVALSFYNNISFLIYRLGFMGTLSASIAAVRCNWFCLDFQPVSNYTNLIAFGSIITLYPSMFVFSCFVWYRNFFIRQFFQQVVSTSHFVTARQPFLVFAFRKKYRTQYIYNKFELIKPFVLKNLKML